MEEIVKIALEIAKRPETSGLAMACLLLGVGNVKLILMLASARDKNRELVEENKRLQERRISDLQESNKIIERNGAAMNSVASMIQTFIATSGRRR